MCSNKNTPSVVIVFRAYRPGLTLGFYPDKTDTSKKAIMVEEVCQWGNVRNLCPACHMK